MYISINDIDDSWEALELAALRDMYVDNGDDILVSEVGGKLKECYKEVTSMLGII